MFTEIEFFGRRFDKRAYEAVEKKHKRDPIDLINSLMQSSPDLAEETKDGCITLMEDYERKVLKIRHEKCHVCGKEIEEGRLLIEKEGRAVFACSEDCKSR